MATGRHERAGDSFKLLFASVQMLDARNRLSWKHDVIQLLAKGVSVELRDHLCAGARNPRRVEVGQVSLITASEAT